MYAIIKDGNIKSLTKRPNWYLDDGNPVSDSYLISEGIYPVIDSDITYDPSFENIKRDDSSLWDVQSDKVVITYTVTHKTLAEVKERKTREINSAYTAEMNALVKEYPETERESWGKQESEARAWLADNTAPTPFMDAVLLVRTSTTKTQLANRIITKSDALADATGQLTGKRHVLEATVAAATTIAEVEAVTW